MLDTNEAIYRQYETLGISKEVLDFGTSVEKELKERFDKIDTNAEYNQLKVIAAMQKNKVNATHFAATTGYGYDDEGRDNLERQAGKTLRHNAGGSRRFLPWIAPPCGGRCSIGRC